MKKVLLALLLIVVTFISFSLIDIPYDHNLHRINHQRLAHQDFPDLPEYHPTSNYLSYTEFRRTIAKANSTALEIKERAKDLYIRFDTADELYRFSVDVSFNPNLIYRTDDTNENVKLSYDVIKVLLSLNYVLGNDIDYRDMKAKKFIPIGYSFITSDDVLYQNLFTGSFDGRGFEIRNLSFAEIDKLKVLDLYGEEVLVTSYYAMFTYNQGEIKNLGLINPQIKINDESLFFASLVGVNENVVKNVYVHSNEGFEVNSYLGVSGIVYENKGSFKEAYFVGSEVVRGEENNLHPIIAINSGSINNLVFDKTLYPYQDNFAIGEDTITLKSKSRLNEGWYFYEDDCYPSLIGLKQEDGVYKINNAIDLIAFSKIIEYQSKNYNEASYELTCDIDMSEVANGAYHTPNVSFKGTFNGNGYYIANLTINTIVTINKVNYGGMFSILEGKVENINFIDIKFDLNEYDYRYVLNLGLITGSLDNGLIDNILLRGNINLGEKTVNIANIGGIAGSASGTISNTCTNGISGNIINGNLHQFEAYVTPFYHLGGIVGSTTSYPLYLINIENNGNIKSISSLNDISNNNGKMIIGGIIGYLYNNKESHHLRLLKNNGNIEINDLKANNYYTYASGIIGLSEGLSFDLKNHFGTWTNTGKIINNAKRNIVKAAGISVSNHSEPVEYIYLQNEDTYTSTSFTNFSYTSLIYHIGSQKVTISQSLNKGNCEFLSYSKNVSPIYISEKNADTVLRFVENEGSILYQGFNLNDETFISGISTSHNIEYLNVYFSGNIVVKDINSNFPLWVAGITNVLNKAIANTLNEGTISFNNIINNNNFYISGIVNKNNNEIINSINDADIKVTIYGIGNLYASGIATLNDGKIADSVNLGNINVKNKSEIENAIITDENNANLITAFKGGVTIGGISAAVLSENSYIVDSINSGDIIGISENYVRTGGIVGIASFDETGIASFIKKNLSNANIRSVINYGNVNAITKNVKVYSSELVSCTFKYYFDGDTPTGDDVTINTTIGTNEKLAVHASSGGILGYGHLTIHNVINHGRISSTDVAGGIIGTVFVNTNSEIKLNLYGNINYGKIHAINQTNYQDLINIDNSDGLASYFYDYNQFIYPETLNDIRRFPESKRGFGGIIGRIQRGDKGIVAKDDFRVLLNFDTDIDFIGRIDQDYNFTDTIRYIRLQGEYYTAKVNDTTQTVFTGFKFYKNANITENHVITATIKREQYTIETIIILVLYRVTIDTDYFVTSDKVTTNISGPRYSKVGNVVTLLDNSNRLTTNPISNDDRWIDFSTTEKTITVLELNKYKETTMEYYNGGKDITLSSNTYKKNIMDENIDIPNIPTTPPSTTSLKYVNQSKLSERFNDYDGLYTVQSNQVNGSYLPNNIKLEKISRLKEQIPFDSDYEDISSKQKENLSEDILNKYHNLHQTHFNEDSFLLDDDVVLSQIDGDVILTDPIINHQKQTITYEVPVNEFKLSETLARFTVESANISDEAIIGANILDYSIMTGINYYNDMPGFCNLLLTNKKPISDKVVPTILATPNSYKNIKKKSDPVLVGYFTIYSEIALNDINYFINSNYTSTYYIYFIYTPRVDSSSNSSGVIKEDKIIIDGKYYNYNSLKNKDIYVDEVIGITFKVTKDILPKDYSMKYISLYYGNQEVNPKYYELNSAPGNNIYFTITASKYLKSGKYTLKYKYFKNSDVFTLDFYLNASKTIETFKVYENDNQLEVLNKQFTSYIKFGTDLNLHNITWTLLDSDESYLNENTYLLSYLNIKLKVSGTLVSVNFLSTTTDNGYYVYELRYRVRSEDNSTYQDYTHQIIEVDFDIKNIYQNQVPASIANLKVLREEESKISIDFGIDEYLYTLSGTNRFIISFDYQGYNGNKETKDISYTCSEYLEIHFGLDANPGNYFFTISYVRGDAILKTFNLDVEKLRGQDAYLRNVTFSNFPEAIYEIGEAYGNGELKDDSIYNLDFYDEGIDYDGAKNKIFNFRINTYVLRFNVNSYLPELVDFLPIGATISRRVNDTWTPEVNSTSSQELINMLAADYRFNNVVTYRVTSEDQETLVYYHIHITDALYNVSFTFNVYFVQNGEIIPVENSELYYKTILINIKNVKTDLEVLTLPIANVREFPIFKKIIDINNKATLFKTICGNNYQYQFAPNLSGFYLFDLVISDDNGHMYAYDIEYNGEVLPDAESYVDGTIGKYFYIEASMKPRNCNFNIYITKTDELDHSWGLSDNYDSWK